MSQFLDPASDFKSGLFGGRGESFCPVVADEGGGETGLRANPGMHVLFLWIILVIRTNW